MAKTQQDLIVEVLNLLNVLGVGETPTAEDRATVEASIAPKVGELERRDIVYVPDIEEIEDEIFEPLATLVAEAVGPKFGQARSPATRLDAENRLREMQGADGAGAGSVRALYY